MLNLADQMKQIRELAMDVIEFVDAREYEKAHSALDEIEIKCCRSVHRHIGKLELVGRVLPSPGS